MTGGATAYLGLGSNLGDRVANLGAALDALERAGLTVEAVSAVYDTPPWGEPPPGLDEPPRYANAAAAIRGDLDPIDLLRLCKGIEVAAGRDLHAARNAPRVLDLDVLLLGDLELATPELEVPHPRMHLRAFVLVPLAEIAPDARHPRLGRTVGDLLDGIDAGEVEEVELLVAAGLVALAAGSPAPALILSPPVLIPSPPSAGERVRVRGSGQGHEQPSRSLLDSAPSALIPSPPPAGTPRVRGGARPPLGSPTQSDRGGEGERKRVCAAGVSSRRGGSRTLTPALSQGERGPDPLERGGLRA